MIFKDECPGGSTKQIHFSSDSWDYLNWSTHDDLETTGID